MVNGPPPKLPDDGRYTKELQEFAGAWYVEPVDSLTYVGGVYFIYSRVHFLFSLMKDNTRRPNYDQLQVCFSEEYSDRDMVVVVTNLVQDSSTVLT